MASFAVIKVNDHVLTAKEFGNQLARKLKNFDALAAKDPNNIFKLKEELLRNFVISSLITDWAEQNKISIQDAELEKEINKYRSNYPDDIAFRRALVEENISLDEWRTGLKMTLLQKAVFKKISEKAVAPTDDEILKYYELNKDQFKRKERVLLRQIVTDDLAKAESIKGELKSKDFISLAKKYSVAPEGKNGGLVGWMEKGSVDIFDKAFQLPVGGVSGVLESSYGFHIFKVDAKAPAGFASLQEMKPVIVSILQGRKEQAEFSSWLDKQIRSSKVLRNNDLIGAVGVETRK